MLWQSIAPFLGIESKEKRGEKKERQESREIDYKACFQFQKSMRVIIFNLSDNSDLSLYIIRFLQGFETTFFTYLSLWFCDFRQNTAKRFNYFQKFYCKTNNRNILF